MNNKALVMFDEDTKLLIPINQGLFSVSQFKSADKLNQMYSGNWILYPDGVVKIIKRINITGAYGETFWSKVLAILNSTKNISVVLEEIHPELASLVEKTKRYLENDLASEDPYMLEQDTSKLKVDEIKSSEQLYMTLSLPPVEDCLDVM